MRPSARNSMRAAKESRGVTFSLMINSFVLSVCVFAVGASYGREGCSMGLTLFGVMPSPIDDLVA